MGVLDRHKPNALCIQETKVQDEDFPHDAFREIGYQAAIHGQKTYNGVALISREPLEDIQLGFEGNPAPEHARVISGTLGGIRIINVYVVNGKEIGTPHYDLKLRWLNELYHWLHAQHTPEQEVLMLGDFNMIPEERDCWDPEYWKDRIFRSEPELNQLQRFLDWGLHDLFRKNNEEDEQYTWWDYRGGSFPRGRGLRIDLALGTQKLLERCNGAEIDRDERKKGKWLAKPSDHAPFVVTFAS